MRSILATAILLAAAPAAAEDWKAIRKKPAEWFGTPEAAKIATNALSWQTEKGAWPKNVDTFGGPARKSVKEPDGTFDNGATVDEVRFLARMADATGREEYQAAAVKAVDHILAAQYPNGGFPQTSPPGSKYPKYVTFNDGTLVNLLTLLGEVATEHKFRFVGDDRRAKAKRAIDRGVECIVESQYRRNGELTAWGAQHDEVTLEPRPARAFEPASLAGAESAGVLIFLMRLDAPAPEVVRAVEAGVKWFRASELSGIKVVKRDGDVVVVRDASAGPVWARFYDLATNEPLFGDRDGSIKRSLAEISRERRTGYAWYGDWGTKVFAAYEKWPHRKGATR